MLKAIWVNFRHASLVNNGSLSLNMHLSQEFNKIIVNKQRRLSNFHADWAMRPTYRCAASAFFPCISIDMCLQFYVIRWLIGWMAYVYVSFVRYLYFTHGMAFSIFFSRKDIFGVLMSVTLFSSIEFNFLPHIHRFWCIRVCGFSLSNTTIRLVQNFNKGSVFSCSVLRMCTAPMTWADYFYLFQREGKYCCWLDL